MSSNPVQAWFFFRPYFQYCFSSVHYCEHRFHIQCLWSSDYLSGRGSLSTGLGRLMLYFHGENGECPSFFFNLFVSSKLPPVKSNNLLHIYCTTTSKALRVLSICVIPQCFLCIAWLVAFVTCHVYFDKQLRGFGCTSKVIVIFSYLQGRKRYLWGSILKKFYFKN